MPRSDDSITAVEMVDPLVGTIFDKRFHIDERLAAGGFGAIYRATHVKSGHQIALKVLHSKLASDLGVLARFRREGTTLTSLRNPHTITAYEFGQSERTLFIVMELLHGDSLYERFETSGPLPWKRVVHIALQVCESLAEAHAQGIIHRDLKPTNIHLEDVNGDPDYVKVLDFGIAKIVSGSEHDASDITNAGQMIGTLDYMSPEQMVGGQVTGQTDIYTLGILMYEMIAGTRPFPESKNASAALAAMLKTTPRSLASRTPVPRDLDALVMRCLERETQKRFRTIHELRTALEQIGGDGASIVTETATVALPEGTSPAAYDVDGDSTTIAPPSDNLLDSLRPSKSDFDTTVLGGASVASSGKGWDDDGPTTTESPDFARPPIASPSTRPLTGTASAPQRPSSAATVGTPTVRPSTSPPSAAPSANASSASRRPPTAPTAGAPVVRSPASSTARPSTSPATSSTSTTARPSTSPATSSTSTTARPSTAPPAGQVSSSIPRTGPHAAYPGAPAASPMSGAGPQVPHAVSSMSGTGSHMPHPGSPMSGTGPVLYPGAPHAGSPMSGSGSHMPQPGSPMSGIGSHMPHPGSPYPGAPYPGDLAVAPYGSPSVAPSPITAADYGSMPYGGPPPMPGYGPPSTHAPYASPGPHGHGMSPRVPTAGYDMSSMAAHDAALRRFVWILVLVVGAIVGFVVATHL